jgi:hypothetical protein
MRDEVDEYHAQEQAEEYKAVMGMLREELGLEGEHADVEAALSGRLGKATECGASMYFTEDGAHITSIVEGVEYTTSTEWLSWKVLLDLEHDDMVEGRKAFWAAVRAVEAEAKQIWMATHGCDGCWPKEHCLPEGDEPCTGCECCEDLDWPGHRRVNPDCKTCGGEGIVI